HLYTFVLPSLVMNLIFCAQLCNSGRVFYNHIQPLKPTELVTPSHLFEIDSIPVPDNSRRTMDSGLSDCENKNPHFCHPNIPNAHDLDHYHVELSEKAAQNPPINPLERGPVPPSGSSGCTYIPGTGGPDCPGKLHSPRAPPPPRHYILDTYGLQLVAQFRDYHPEKFSGQGDPRIVDEWIQGLELIFEVMDCSDRYRVTCAQLQLTGDARLWWNAYWSMRPGEKEGCTWERLKELIREKYYPTYYRAEMERQFLSLKQGTRSVDEYEREFTRLAAF
ncbi:Unknown protein, partial [Striga hermonthica]